MAAQIRFDDFESYSVGSLAGFTMLGAAALAVTATGPVGGTKAFGPASPIDASQCFYGAATLPADQCVQGTFIARFTGANSSSGISPLLRVVSDGTVAGTTGYLISFSADGAGKVACYSKSGTTYTAVGTLTTILSGIVAGNVLGWKAELTTVAGTTTAKAKYWNVSQGQSEPGSWTTLGTSAAFNQAGKVGLSTFKAGSYSGTVATLDNLYMGDAGATFPAPSTGTVALTSGSAVVGQVQTFTVTFDRAYTGTMTPAITSGTATGTPSAAQSLTAASTATFTITWTGAGSSNVGATYSDSLTSVPVAQTIAANTAATTTTLTLGASSGPAGLPVTLTYGADGTFSGTKALTLSDGGAGGTFGSPSSNPLSSATTGTVSYTPPPSGTTASITLTATLAGLTAASQGYSATADTVTMTPTVFALNAVTAVTFTSLNGLYASAPSIAASGVSGASLGTITRVNSTTATANLTTAGAAGVVTFTDSTQGGAATTALIQAAGQVADFKLAGISDLAGNGHDLMVGFPTAVPNYVTAGTTTGLQLGGINFLVADAVGFTGAAGFTGEITFRVDSLAKSQQVLMGCWGKAGQQVWLLYLNSGVLTFLASPSVTVAGTTTLAAGTTYKVAAGTDGAGNAWIYLDAAREGLNASAGNITPAANLACPLYIGAHADTGSDLRATITVIEARLSSGGLYSGTTRAVPASLANTGATVARYDFQQPTGAFSGYMLRPGTSATILARGFRSGSYTDGGLANPAPPKPAPGGGYFIDFDSWDNTLALWGRWIARGPSIEGPWTADSAPYRTVAGDEGNLTGNGQIILFNGTYFDYYHTSTGSYFGPIYVRTSTDLATWTARAVAVPTASVGWGDPAVAISSDGSTLRMYLVNITGTRVTYTATSTDGLTWTTPVVAVNLAGFPGYTNAFGEPFVVHGGTHRIATTDGRLGTSVGRSLWLHRSIDSGATWHPLGEVLAHQVVGKLGAFDSAPYVLAAGNQLSLIHAEQDTIAPTDATQSDLVATTFNLPNYVGATGLPRWIRLRGGMYDLAGGCGN